MNAWNITKKDLRLLTRDLRALTVLLALPLLFITLLGFSTGQLLGWKSENQILKIVAVNQDQGDISPQILEALNSRDGIEVNLTESWDQATLQVEERTANVALMIGPNFQELVDNLILADILSPSEGDLAGGLESLDMKLAGDAGSSAPKSIVRQLTFAETLRIIAPYVARKSPLARRAMDEARETRETEQPVQEAEDEETEKQGGSGGIYQEIVPGYTVLFVFFLVNIMSRSFIHERDLGTLRRLRLAPVSSTSILLGKTLPFLMLSIVQTVLLFLCGKVLFGMSWGPSPGLLFPVIFCTSLAATGLGLLVAASVRSDSQVTSYGNMIVILMAGLSGCFIPRDWLPIQMQQLSLITPHSWALMAYQNLLSTPRELTQRQVMEVWQYCGMLLLFFVIYFLAGIWRFRKLR